MEALTPRTAQKVGLSRGAFYRDAREGRLDRIARGIYLPAEAPAMDWDLIEASTRRPDATICLTSALAHYDLTDEIPATVDVAIPRGSEKTDWEVELGVVIGRRASYLDSPAESAAHIAAINSFLVDQFPFILPPDGVSAARARLYQFFPACASACGIDRIGVSCYYRISFTGFI